MEKIVRVRKKVKGLREVLRWVKYILIWVVIVGVAIGGYRWEIMVEGISYRRGKRVKWVEKDRVIEEMIRRGIIGGVIRGIIAIIVSIVIGRGYEDGIIYGIGIFMYSVVRQMSVVISIRYGLRDMIRVYNKVYPLLRGVEMIFWLDLIGGEGEEVLGVIGICCAEVSYENGDVSVKREGGKYKIELRGEIEMEVDEEKVYDIEVIMVMLRLLRDKRGKRIITLQGLAEGFGYKSRQNIDLKMNKYREAGDSLIGLIPTHKKSVLREEVVKRIKELWIKDVFMKPGQIKEILIEERTVKNISEGSIRNAVKGVDFNRIRKELKKRLERGEVSLSNNYMVGRLVEIIEGLVKREGEKGGLKGEELSEVEMMKEEIGYTPRRHNYTKGACIRDFLFGRIKRSGIICPECGEAHVGKKSGEGTVVEVRRLDGKIEEVMTYRHYCWNKDCPVGSFTATEEGEFVYSEEEYMKKFMAFRLYVSLGMCYREVASLLGIYSSTCYYWVMFFGEVVLDVVSLFGTIRFSGSACIDEKWVKIPKNDKPQGKRRKWMYVYMAVDPFTYDLLHIDVFKENDYTATKTFLLGLKAKGYEPKVIVTDMLPSYENAIAEVFPNAVHHYCIFHALQGFQRKIKEVYGNNYKKEHPEAVALKKKIYKLFKAKDKRTVIKRFKKIMGLRKRYLKANSDSCIIFDSLKMQFPKLVNAIGKDNIPNTSNAVELVIRKFTQHYKRMCGFESIQSCRRYLRVFELAYRFAPLGYEVKDPNMRGRCPLEIAGYEVRSLPIWKYLSTPIAFKAGPLSVNFSP